MLAPENLSSHASQMGSGMVLSAALIHTSWEPASHMELEGRLNPSMQLPDILQFLSTGKMTGMLTINSGNYTASLTLRNGRLINSSSMGRPRRLGQMLTQRGLVSRNSIEQALQYQKTLTNPLPLGRLLVQQGHLSIEQLRQAIRLQLEEELWELFSLSEGVFKFDVGDDTNLGDALVDLDVEPLIIEGARRLDEWRHIEHNIPDESVIPAVNPDADLVDREMMNFSYAEWRVLSMVNGRFDVGSLVTRSGLGKFETFRILNSLMTSDYLIAKPGRATGGTGVGHSATRAVESGEVGFSSSRLRAVMMSMAPLSEVPVKQGTGRFQAVEPSQIEVGEFVFRSPAGFVVGLGNHVLSELVARPDFSLGNSDSRIAEQCWITVIMQYPKADLIMANGNSLDSTRLERFIECIGLEGSMRAIYDDSMEALGRYLRMLSILASQRLGNREGHDILRNVFDSFRGRSVIGRAENFYWQDFCSRILT